MSARRFQLQEIKKTQEKQSQEVEQNLRPKENQFWYVFSMCVKIVQSCFLSRRSFTHAPQIYSEIYLTSSLIIERCSFLFVLLLYF